MKARRAKATAAAKRSSGSNFLSFFFNTITVVSMGTAFWIMSSSPSSSIPWASTHGEPPGDPEFYTLQSSSEPDLESPTRTATVPSEHREATTIHLPLVEDSSSHSVHSEASSARTGVESSRSVPSSDLTPSSNAGGAPAKAALRLEHEQLATNTTKKIVPLATPQGYDSVARTLTLAKWQVLGVPYDPVQDSPAIAQADGEPAPGLLHQAHPASNEGVVMGLAAYPNDIMGKLERFVGTLRFTGYQGHIILGVHPNISPREQRYLAAMNVTTYASDAGPCVSPLAKAGDGLGEKGSSGGRGGGGTNYIRGTCSKSYNRLVFEWARYEMALGWLKACKNCQGWMLVCDVKDTVFQRPPFEDLPRATPSTTPDLMLFEEAYPPPLGFDNNHWFAWGSIKNCFGKENEHEIMKSYRNKAVLCSGSTVGTREGLGRYLAAITRRYYELTWLGSDCTPPMAVDQPVHNWLFYTAHGYATDETERAFGGTPLGEKAVSVPFGSGPVQTVGRLCSMGEKAELTLGTLSQVNLSVAPATGLFLNHDGLLAPVVHQHDRCWGIWAKPLRDLCTRAHDHLRPLVEPGAVRNAKEVCKGG